jgi:hypothetical protein
MDHQILVPLVIGFEGRPARCKRHIIKESMRSLMGDISRNRPCSTPLIHGLLAMSSDLVAVSQEGHNLRVLPDPINSPVEVRRLAIPREDVLIQEIRHTTLEMEMSDTNGRDTRKDTKYVRS